MVIAFDYKENFRYKYMSKNVSPQGELYEKMVKINNKYYMEKKFIPYNQIWKGMNE